MAPFVQRNLWQDTAPPFSGAPPLAGAVKADVVIIGGGFTGLSAALRLAQAGAAVRLLEAETIGHGASGRNVGLVNAGLWLPSEQVEKQLGKKNGRKLNEALAAGPGLVFSLIERHGITCDAVRNGTLHCAHSPAGLADLRERFRQEKARAAPIELLDAANTAALTGARGFGGALLDHRAGTIQPLAYARGLARAAVEARAAVHEGTPVLLLTESGGGWRVDTPSGSVNAKALILATNAYCDHIEPKLRPTFTPFHYFQCATEPLAARLRQTILPERHGCWDTGRIMSSFRLDAESRLILGGMGSLDSLGGTFHVGWARRKLAALFPQIKGIGFSHCWAGRIAMTGDHLPKIIALGPCGLSIHGYSGRGIGAGTVFGKAAAEFVISENPEVLPLAPMPAHAERLTGLKQIFYETAAIFTHMASGRTLR